MVRVATASEHPRLMALYEEWGYRGGITPDDVVFIAEEGDEAVGLVRRAGDGGIIMLRGMYVAPHLRRSGVGTRLLAAFVDDLQGSDCYCIPLAHLTAFYRRAGFTVVAEHAAPPMLAERLRRYRSEGHRVVLMRRPPNGRDVDRAG
jgi:GNAT superfamily N-acetyltransferase